MCLALKLKSNKGKIISLISTLSWIISGRGGKGATTRIKRRLKAARLIIIKNGRPASQGTCPTCGAKMVLEGANEAACFS